MLSVPRQIYYRGTGFRPEYKALGCLRAILPCTPVLALTATANTHMMKDIADSLHLPDSLCTVTLVPDRLLLPYQ